MCIMVCLHTDQKLSSVKDLPNYTMAMHWLMFLCLVGSTRTRLLEIDGDGDRNVGVVDLSEVQGDVGIIIGLQSLVKARIENMVKDMEDRGKVEEAWRTEMREKFNELTENRPGSMTTVPRSSTPPTSTTTSSPTTTTRPPVEQSVVRTSNKDGRSLITLTRGDEIAIFARVQQDCLEGAMEINFVKAKWRNFVPVPEVEYIKGYFERHKLCVLMTEDRRARVTCSGRHVADVVDDEGTWFLCVGTEHYGVQHIEL